MIGLVDAALRVGVALTLAVRGTMGYVLGVQIFEGHLGVRYMDNYSTPCAHLPVVSVTANEKSLLKRVGGWGVVAAVDSSVW